MANLWANDIELYLRQQGKAVSLVTVGKDVPRPVSCSQKLRLNNILRKDSRFIITPEGTSQYNVSLVGFSSHAHNPQLRIPQLVSQFTEYLNTLTEDELVKCEKQSYLYNIFIEWKTRNNFRGSFLSALQRLEKTGIATIYRKRIILIPSNQPERLHKRKEYINKILNRPTKEILHENKNDIIVSEFNFHINPHNNEPIIIPLNSKHSVYGYIENNSTTNIIVFKRLHCMHTL